MSVTTVSVATFSDDGSIHSTWVVADADVVERIRALLGEPACEVMMDSATADAIEQAGDTGGAVVLFPGDS